MMANLLYKLSHSQKCMNFCKLRVYHRGLGTSVRRFDETVVIPNRIPRSPTAVLEALASTVSRDKSGPHYKYMDDPFLTPVSNIDKKSFSLSKESGRKAARWISQTHSRLFQHHPDDPVIKAFLPKESYTEESDVSEATIADLIQKVLVSDAVQVYKICQSKGIELSEKICQDLLELVCYYNGEDAREEDWTEEYWHKTGSGKRHAGKKTWNKRGVAEEIFNSFGNKGSRAYCALIRGMTAYHYNDRAWELFEEAKDKGIALDTDTYNSLILTSAFFHGKFEKRWGMIEELLTTMASKGIKPNLGTLNSVLESLTYFTKWRMVQNTSLKVIAEFKSIGIEPSLASLYHLLLIHSTEITGGPINNILVYMLDYLEGRSLEVVDLKDSFFFLKAMDIACEHLKSLDVAQRVHKLLCSGDNYRLIGDSSRESLYYRLIFTIVCAMEVSDDMMKFYNEFVPHVYSPEIRVILQILENLKVHNALHFLPQIWSDMKVSGIDHPNAFNKVLQCVDNHKLYADNEQLTNQISEIALDMWSMYKTKKESNFKFQNYSSLTNETLSSLIITLVNCGKYDNAVEIFQESLRSSDLIGSASPMSLKLLSQVAVDKKDSAQAIDVVLYAVDHGHPEAFEWAKNISSSLNLTPVERDQLASLQGDRNERKN